MQIVYYNHERQKLKYMIGANDTDSKRKKKKKKRKKRVKREPRMLLGFREVKRSAHHGELQCVVIAPDIEVSRNKDGLDDTVNEIVENCRRHDIPVFFCMSRRRLAKTLLRPVCVSVVGIVNAEGAHAPLRDANSLLSELELRLKLRESAWPTIEIANNVSIETGKFVDDLVKEMDVLLEKIGPAVLEKKKNSRKKKLSSTSKEFVPKSYSNPVPSNMMQYYYKIG